jgi:aspartate aminotransferase
MLRAAKRITQTSKKSFGMYDKAARKAATGADLIHMELGSPYADTPGHIKQATIDALLRGDVHYSDMQGLPALRQALAAKLRQQNAMAVTKDNVLVTSGITHGSFATFMALLDPGDEVILLEPYYPQHIGKIELAGAKVVLAELDAASNFAIDPERIAARITQRTRMIVLVNPVNPTGRVYTRAELAALAELAIRHDLIVVSDEVYEDIVFDHNVHISIASLPGMAERTITLFAFTKSYAMDGWRLGYLAADVAFMPALLKITTNDVTHINTFIQAGAYAAICGPRAALDELVREDRQKRDYVVQRLNQLPGVTCRYPEATIYAFPDIRQTGHSAQALADLLLERAGVVVEAGSFYGAAGEGHLRVCFGSQPMARLQQAMDRMQRFFAELEHG